MTEYLRMLFSEFRFRMMSLLLVFFLTALFEGVGLLCLIPLLSLAGISVGAQEHSVVTVLSHWLLHQNIHLALGSVLIVFVMLMGFISGLSRLSKIWGNRLQLDFCRHLRLNLYAALVNSNWHFLSQQKQADVAHLLNNEISRVGFAVQQLFQLLSTGLVVCLYVLASFYLSWRLMLCAVWIGAAGLLVNVRLNRKIQANGRELHYKVQGLYQGLLLFWGGLKVIKSFGAKERQIAHFTNASEAMMDCQRRLTRLTADAQFFIKMAGVITFSVFFFLAIAVFQVGVAKLLLLLVMMARVLPRFGSLQGLYQVLLNSRFSLSEVFRLTQLAASQAEPLVTGVPPCFKTELELQAVSVSYPQQNAPSLKKITLKIPAYSVLALVGNSGSGKSTLSDVLAGIVFPDEGKMVLDNSALSEKETMCWRTAVGYVTQDAFLFAGTVRENLSFGQAVAPPEPAMWEVLNKAQLVGVIERLPGRLDFQLSDHGGGLSGGERQRLALARVLLRRPSLLILDEATSQVDHQQEGWIYQAILPLRKELTIIMITHRLHMAQLADQIIWMKSGEIHAKGSWLELGARLLSGEA